jgi:predicted N-formylglutamate amidohydrolase
VDAPSPFVVTCEHGGNRIPAAYRRHFDDHAALLDSHRGYDAGALEMAKGLSRALAAPLVASTTSRLLVDLNRSIGHPRLHSDATRAADAAVRARIVERHYRPYRDKVDRAIDRAIAQHGRAIHISSHSFTPVLDGVVRKADVGLLYDPCRVGERELCARWKASLASLAPQLRVRLNYPYAGKGDGVTRLMRKRYPPQTYVGVELEINQRVLAAEGSAWPALRAVLIESLRDATRSLLPAVRHRRAPPAPASRAPRAPAGGHD